MMDAIYYKDNWYDKEGQYQLSSLPPKKFIFHINALFYSQKNMDINKQNNAIYTWTFVSLLIILFFEK